MKFFFFLEFIVNSAYCIRSQTAHETDGSMACDLFGRREEVEFGLGSAALSGFRSFMI